jgi:hypothetical protein
MDRGLTIYPINPKQLGRSCDRLSTADADDDRRDALVLASCCGRIVTASASEKASIQVLCNCASGREWH